MKDPRTLFPFMFAASWVGNLLLTVLAFFLAFTQEGPLTPLLFGIVALCILSGNLLPICVYWILVRWRQAELQAEAAEAAVRVRDALRRSEDVMGRLDEAEGALSKAILVARQVPERIREGMGDLEAVSEALREMELSSFTEALASQGEGIASAREEISSLSQGLDSLQGRLKELPGTMEKFLRDSLPEAGTAPGGNEDDVSVAERLDLLYESLEAVQDSLDGLLDRVANLQSPLAEAKPSSKAAKSETPPQDEPEKPPSPRPKRTVKAENPAQESLELEPEPEAPPADQETPANTPADRVELVVHAMVGINNKVFIRGDGPWLSWDAGRPMDLIGIGEFAWKASGVHEPVEVAVYLNDDQESSLGTLRLEPGKPQHHRASFTRT